MRRLLLPVLAAALVAAPAAAHQTPAPDQAADGRRRRWRGRERRPAGHAGRDRHLAPRRQRRRRRDRRRGRARGRRALFVRHRRRRLHDRLLRARRQGPHHRLARDGAGGDERPVVRRPAELREPARQRHERRRPRHAARLAEGAARVRDLAAEPRAAAGHRRGAARLHRRPDLLQPDRRGQGDLRRLPGHRGAVPRPRRLAARRRDRHQEPRPRAHLRAHRAARAPTRCTRAARAGDRRHRQASAAAPGLDARRRAPASWSSATSRAYKAIDRDPTHIGYRGLDVYGMAPPSSAAARRSARASTSSRAIRTSGTMPRERALHSISRPRAWPTPTAARSWRTRLRERSARRSCSRISSRRSAGPRSPSTAATSPVAPPATRAP